MSNKVLVVDDSEIARKELVNPLNKAGLETVEADSGKTAVDVVKAGGIVLIITDIHMPIMNGIEMCEALKADPAVSELPPILVASTETNPEFKERGKAAGVRGWIIKPVDTEKLVVIAKKLTGL